MGASGTSFGIFFSSKLPAATPSWTSRFHLRSSA